MTKYNLDKFYLIALGSIPGAFIRWQVNNDFIVNFCGAFLIGLLVSLSLKSKWNLILGVGFCGSLTTFSGWILDSFLLINNGLSLKAFYLISMTFLCGLSAVAIGFFIGRKINLLMQNQLL